MIPPAARWGAAGISDRLDFDSTDRIPPLAGVIGILKYKENNMNLMITEKALSELRANGVGKDSYLRLAVKPGGCAGMSYDMIVDETLNLSDKVIYESGDLQVIADSDSVPYLDGLQIDFSDDLIEAGFRLRNPTARNSCGCGSSFSCH